MDLRTGRMYESKEAARAAGVPESDIAEVVMSEEHAQALQKIRGEVQTVHEMAGPDPKVRFSKNVFGSFKNAPQATK